jgi:hypothetical protein
MFATAAKQELIMTHLKELAHLVHNSQVAALTQTECSQFADVCLDTHLIH